MPTIEQYLKQFFSLTMSQSKEQFLAILTDYYPKEETLSPSQVQALKDIYQTVSYINNLLAPLAGLPYDLGVTGGAVYDMVTNKSHMTKDMDIVLGFPISPGYNKRVPAHLNNDQNLDGEYAPKWDEDITQIKPQYQKVIHNLYLEYLPGLCKEQYVESDLPPLVCEVIKDHINITKVYHKNENLNQSAYTNQAIEAVIKINDNHLPKPVDLIIAKGDTGDFAAAFDFDICKMFINFQYGLKPESNLLQGDEIFDVKKLLAHLFIAPRAVSDLQNKTITMKLPVFGEDDIHHFMARHYPRLHQKLPEYRLNFITDEDKKPIADYYLLQEKLRHKSDKIKPNKI